MIIEVPVIQGYPYREVQLTKIIFPSPNPNILQSPHPNILQSPHPNILQKVNIILRLLAIHVIFLVRFDSLLDLNT